MEKVNLGEKLDQVRDHWVPRVVGELNGQHLRIVKILGEYVWHRHEHEDELFLVLDGEIEIQFRDRSVPLSVGEFLIISRGEEHRPVAEREASVLLFEPATTRNTGNVEHTYTIEASDVERL